MPTWTAPNPSSKVYTKCPDDISFEPIKKDIRRTSWTTLKSDMGSGLAVALLSIPLAIAYSIAIGVPPRAGLLATIFGTIIASLLGSSRHLIIGPNNATVMLVQTAACEIFATTFASKLNYEYKEMGTLGLMSALTMLIGAIQILASVFKFGRILQFVSYAVVIGYIAGSALAITIDQIFTATALACPDYVDTLFQKIIHIISHIHQVHLPTIGITIASFALLLFFKKKNPLKILPSSLLMLTVVTGTVVVFNIGAPASDGAKTIQLAGNGFSLIPGEMSSVFDNRDDSRLEFDLSLLNSLIPVAFAIAFIGMLETNSIAKSIAAKSGQQLTPSQEVFALGCSNLCISFLSALPCSGSISRTATNFDSGAVTRFSGIFSGIFVAAIIVLLGQYIAFIPQASLAAILLSTAPRMVDRKQILLCLKATKSDALVITATFLACIFFSLHIAFYLGVTLSIALYLRKAATPRVVEYQYIEQTDGFKPMSEAERASPHPIRIINVEGELFFGAVDLFQYALRAMAEDDEATRVIILRLKHVHDLDATAALALKQLKEFLDRKGRSLIISSVPPHVASLLENSKLFDLLGRENVILFDEHSPHSSLKRAFERAKVLLSL